MKLLNKSKVSVNAGGKVILGKKRANIIRLVESGSYKYAQVSTNGDRSKMTTEISIITKHNKVFNVCTFSNNLIRG